jgi:D-glycero-D-manno-heptose 1,7-bisphosphate phosphatase
MRKRIVFLDRDGTINVEQSYLSSVEGMRLLPGAAEGIRLLNELRCPVVIVSNQTVVGRGNCSLETLQAINRRMLELLAEQGAVVNEIYYCTHLPDEGCACRKPNTGLLENAARVFGAELHDSFLVGDKCSDIQAGLNAGSITILVRTGYGLNEELAGRCTPHFIVDDLRTAAEQISGMLQRDSSHVVSHPTCTKTSG